MQTHTLKTQELKNKNLIILYGPSQSGKSTIAREFLKDLKIIRDRRGRELDQIESGGKILFEIGSNR